MTTRDAQAIKASSWSIGDETFDRPKRTHTSAQHVLSLFDSHVALLENEKPTTDQSMVNAFQPYLRLIKLIQMLPHTSNYRQQKLLNLR